MSKLWSAEPVAVLAFVQSVLVLVVTFGVDLTDEQTGAVLAVTSALLGLLARRQVTSPRTRAELEGGHD